MPLGQFHRFFSGQSIRIRNEKMLEEAVRETIRARGSQDIETAKAGYFFVWDAVGDQKPPRFFSLYYRWLVLPGNSMGDCNRSSF